MQKKINIKLTEVEAEAAITALLDVFYDWDKETWSNECAESAYEILVDTVAANE